MKTNCVGEVAGEEGGERVLQILCSIFCPPWFMCPLSPEHLLHGWSQLEGRWFLMTTEADSYRAAFQTCSRVLEKTKQLTSIYNKWAPRGHIFGNDPIKWPNLSKYFITLLNIKIISHENVIIRIKIGELTQYVNKISPISWSLHFPLSLSILSICPFRQETQ